TKAWLRRVKNSKFTYRKTCCRGSLRTRRESSAASVRSIRSFARSGRGEAPLLTDQWSCGERVGTNTRIDQYLDLVTTIFAGPEMTDFVLAHVLRPLRRNHQLITFSARHSVERAINNPSGRHDHLPYCSFLYGVGN